MGLVPTGMAAPRTVLSAVSITVTVLSRKLATKARWAVGSTPTPRGRIPTMIVLAATVFVVVSITDTVSLPLFIGDVGAVDRRVYSHALGDAPHEEGGDDSIGRGIDHRHRVAGSVGDV